MSVMHVVTEENQMKSSVTILCHIAANDLTSNCVCGYCTQCPVGPAYKK